MHPPKSFIPLLVQKPLRVGLVLVTSTFFLPSSNLSLRDTSVEGLRLTISNTIWNMYLNNSLAVLR